MKLKLNIFLFFTVIFSVFAQEKQSLLYTDQLMFEHLGANEGLMHNSITTILQDAKGFMWFGTSNGLYKYDGYQFLYYSNSPDDNFSLLSNKVTELYEDSNGVIWVGTKSGLCHYNRMEDRFKSGLNTRGSEDDGRLISDPIRCVYEDANKTLWVGTRFGLYEVKRTENGSHKITIHTTGIKEGSLSNNTVNTIIEDEEGRLWIGTNIGLNQLQYSKEGDVYFKTYFSDATKNWLTNNIITEIIRDKDEGLWIGTRRGLNKLTFDKKTGKEVFTSYIMDKSKKNTISNNYVSSLSQDKKGVLWIGFKTSGMNAFNPKTGVFNDCSNSPSQDTRLKSTDIMDVLIDRTGILWIATSRGWISKLNIERKKIEHFKHNRLNLNSLSGNVINTVYQDAKNNIWVAAYNKGLNRLVFEDGAPKFVKYILKRKAENSIVSNNIFALCEDNFGNYWAASQASGMTHFKMSSNLNSSDIQSYEYSNHRQKGNFPINKLAVLTKDKKGDIWVGAYDKGGLIQFTPNDFGQPSPEFHQYLNNPNNENSLSVSNVACVFEDSEGILWVGTNGGGLNKILRDENNKPIKFIRIRNEKNNPKSLSNDYVSSIYEDLNGNIWVGTFGGGLNMIPKDQKNNMFPELKRYSMDDGLPSNELYGVLGDVNNNLWLSTNNGLSVFDIEKETFSNLHLSDGLQALNYRKYAYTKGNDGLLYFGGIGGLNVLDPTNIEDNSYAPQVEVVDIKILNESVQVGKKVLGKVILNKTIDETTAIELEYAHNTFSFEFAALHYASPMQNQYKYMLEGFDEDWISTTSDRRFAGYSNLEPGNYLFKVKVSNKDNLWNEAHKEIAVKILPPIWKTWYAYLLYVVLIIMVMWLFRRYVLINEVYQNKLKIEKIEQEKIKEINKMKLEFFTNVSHEFKTPLTLILGPLQSLLNSKETSAKVKGSLLLMERNANQLFRLINQIMEFRKLETKELKLDLSKGDLVNFCKEEVFSFKVLAEKKNIDIVFQSGENSIEGYYDWDKMEKILNNLISNSIKYTNEGGAVKLSLSLVSKTSENDTAKSVQIIVEDTGEGIPQGQLNLIFDRFYQIRKGKGEGAKGSGIGLALTKSLIDLHKGTIQVESEEKKGTKFTVALPLLTELSSLGQPANRLEGNTDELMTKEKDEPEASVSEEKEIRNTVEQVTPAFEEEFLEKKPKPTILVVEDNPDMLLFISNTLEPNYKIHKAKDGVKGLKSALKVVPDLIISDVMMPNMDGIEFCDAIKKHEITSHIPVILLTAKGSMDHRIEGLEVGADAYIPKPFDIRHLEVRIQTLLDQREKLKNKFSSGEIKLDSQKIGINKMEKDFLERLEAVVEENLSNSDFGVEDLGDAMGYSKMQLYRKLKSMRGLSANEFIREYRIKKAAVYLRETDMKIFEILYEVGISNHSYFTKCFKQYFEQSPREYIEMYRGK